MNQDKWIENVLNSTNGIIKVEPNDMLFSKIEKRIQDNNVETKNLTWLVAASIILFLSLSFILLQMNSSSKKETVSSFREQLNIDNQLY